MRGQSASIDPLEAFLAPTADLLRRVADLERAAGRVRTPHTVYTPAISGTGWALGNATVAGQWCEDANRNIDLSIQFTIGSTTTKGTGGISFSLPSGITAARDTFLFGGTLQTVGGIFTPIVQRVLSTSLTPYALSAINQMNNGGVTATFPQTWGTGDKFLFEVRFEATT